MVVERIAGYFGHRAVTHLTLMQGPLPQRPKRRIRRIRPLDDDGERALAECLAATDDPALRASLERLGRAILGGSETVDAAEGLSAPAKNGA